MKTLSSSLSINRYNLINRISERSFSYVYRVKDKKRNEFYAAKVSKYIIDDDSIDSQRFNLVIDLQLVKVFLIHIVN